MTRQHSANSKQWVIRVPNPEIYAKNAESNMAYTRGRGELTYQDKKESRETSGANLKVYRTLRGLNIRWQVMDAGKITWCTTVNRTNKVQKG